MGMQVRALMLFPALPRGVGTAAQRIVLFSRSNPLEFILSIKR
ncbi:hypothetical protein [uncultured Thalassospira sp.]|tara:strand:- start:7200 stop:7328 length:129 start_codon:yes stop_codon:yes gene_type:complete